MEKSFFQSALNFSIFTSLSRVLGLIRDQSIAIVFGASGLTDAFLIAFKIPNFFRRLFGESAFAQAFVPILSEAKVKSNLELKNVVDHIGTKFLLILFLVTLLVTLFAPFFVMIFAWGFYIDIDQTKYNTASYMLVITAPYLFFISFTAFSGSILNVYEKYAIQAFTPVILNISLILSTIYFSKFFHTPIYALAWGVFFGGIFQLLFQFPFLYKIRKIPKFKLKKHPSESKLLKRLIPTIIGVSVTQVNLFFDMVIATFLVTGSITWLYFSDRFVELPLALIGISLATVSLTKLSNAYNKKEYDNFNQTVGKAIKTAVIFSFPAILGLVFLSKEILFTTIQYSSFTQNDAIQSSYSLIGYAVGLIGFVFIKIFATIFLSMGDTKTPVKAGVASLIVNIILNITLAYFFSHVGIAVSTSIAAYVNLLILFYFVKKRQTIEITLESSLLIKVLLSCLIMCIFLYFFPENVDFYVNSSASSRVYDLFLSISGACILYFGSLKIFGVKYR